MSNLTVSVKCAYNKVRERSVNRSGRWAVDARADHTLRRSLILNIGIDSHSQRMEVLHGIS